LVGLLLFLSVAAAAIHAQAPVLPDSVEWSSVLSAQPQGAPVVAGSVIAVPVAGGALLAHRRTDGHELWKVELGAEKPLATDDERIYVASGEAIHALAPETGKTVWRVPLAGKPTAAPVPRGGWVIAVAAGELVAIRADDGSVIWRRQVGAIEFRPALDGELLVAPLIEGRVLALDVRTGEPLWERILGSAPTEPLVIGGHVYVGTADKAFFTLDGETGRIESRWRIGAEVRGRAAVDDRHVYFAAMDNVLRAIDRGNGALRWKVGLTYRPAAGPVVLGGAVVVPGDVDVLPAYDGASGKPVGKIAFSARLAVLPAFALPEGGPPAVIAVTGSLENKWLMWAMMPSPVPALPVQPLAALPGEAMPLPVAPTPPV
jgi:outer membrane protein assembly factor BamB